MDYKSIVTCCKCGFTGKYIKINFHKPKLREGVICEKCFKEAQKIKEEAEALNASRKRVETAPEQPRIKKPSRYALTKERRRLREEMAEGSHTREEFEEKVRFREYRCHYCGKQFPRKQLYREHLTPLIRGGSNDINNIEPACYRCNFSKGTRTEEEYRKSS